MTTEKEPDIVADLAKLFLDMMRLAEPPPVPGRYASVESVQALQAELMSLRDFLYAASKGDLSRQIPFRGYIAGALKTLQANLKHMTWQTKMIASGDFTQRIEFMGEFSQSFNSMVIQLDQTLRELVGKEAELRQANEELLRENNIRKQTEAALRRSEEALKLLAITDPLTGLYNRRQFNELAEAEISKAFRYERPLSLIIFDIDFFKHVNDTYGHACGDLVLKMVSKTTRESLRAGDIPARYGGEEFIVLLPETPAAQAAVVAERLRRRIGDAIVQGEKCMITITVSFGVSDYVGKPDAKSRDRALSELTATADAALYASKNAGRNRVTLYAPAEA